MESRWISPPVFLFFWSSSSTKPSSKPTSKERVIGYMKNSVRITLVGDYNPTHLAHVAIPRAIELAASELGCEFELTWLPTDSPELAGPPQLDDYHGIWCVPGSPYTSTDGALHAITFARTH